MLSPGPQPAGQAFHPLTCDWHKRCSTVRRHATGRRDGRVRALCLSPPGTRSNFELMRPARRKPWPWLTAVIWAPTAHLHSTETWELLWGSRAGRQLRGASRFSCLRGQLLGIVFSFNSAKNMMFQQDLLSIDVEGEFRRM